MNTVIPSTPAPFGFDILAHNLLGQPISHTSGQFAGRTIRTELRCWQSPLQGRKCATQTGPKVNSRKDCRRIDPPPIVGLRLFDCLPDGREVEIPDYREMFVFRLQSAFLEDSTTLSIGLTACNHQA